MQKYSVDFEENDSGFVLTIKNVWADSGEDAIEKAKKIFNHPASWNCIGLDRMKD
ncbi:hypothetical protein D3C87_325140 [compost metagenome]